MKERKVWNNQEDRVLKLLIEERGMTKWAQISQVMEKEFLIHGRNGKQCRQRYHNHLDKNISNEQWSHQEENTLFDMQDQYGNKWALIASKLPGRSDNCVKNHFYSKLRKGLRKINKKIHKYLKKQYKDIKTATLYKVIETMENRNKGNNHVEEETLELCRKIKNKLREYDDSTTNFQDQNDQLLYIRVIIQDMTFFDKDIKKNGKKGSLKSSLIDDEPASPSRLRLSAKLSTKSVYDGQDSEYSNSDLFSSSSFDHRSFCSMRSNRSNNKSPSKQLLKVQQNLFRSQSIASQSQNDSDPQNSMHLCKSANSIIQANKVRQSKRDELTNSLSLPTGGFANKLGNSWNASKSMKLPSPDFTSTVDQQQIGIKKQQSQKVQSQSSKSKKSKQSDEAQNQNQIFFSYMMGEQPFQMRLFSPKKLTVEEKIQMDHEQDDLFYGQNMQIESQGQELIQNMNGLSISGIPTLSRNRDL